MKNNNAVAYCRFSSDKQREESIDAQKEAIQKFARDNGYIIIKWYIDRALSAKTANRPEFQQMITDSYNKSFRFVIVHKQDRFSRDKYDSVFYKKKLSDNKVKVLSAAEPNLDGYAGIMIDSVMEANAAGYSINLANEVRKGMRMNAKKAQCNGGVPPFGYKRIPKKNKDGDIMVNNKGKIIYDIVINTINAEAVKLIFNMTLAGKSYKDILKELDLKGYKHSHGKAFLGQSLEKILRNERYTGTYIFDPSKKYKADEGIDEEDLEEDSEHKIIRVVGGFPQIISYEAFNAVQTIMNSRKHRPSSQSKVDYLLTGKIVCGECGATFTGCSHYKKGQPYFYYRCGRANGFDCKVVSVRKEPLENFVLNEMERVVNNEKFVSQILDRFVEFYKQKNNKNEIINNLEKAKLEVENKINNLVDIIANNSDFSEMFQIKLNALANEKSKLLENIKNESNFNFSEFITKEEIRRTYFKVLNLLKVGNTEDKATIINTLLNRVIVYKERVEVFINLLPLTNSSANLQITDKDLATYGLLEPNKTKDTAIMGAFPSKNSSGVPKKLKIRIYLSFFIWLFKEMELNGRKRKVASGKFSRPSP